MHVSFTKEELAFQQEVRKFLEEEYPHDIRQKKDSGKSLSRDDTIRWQKILHKKGWAAVNWPIEYGGTGWTTIQKYIFENEMGRVNAPPFVPFGMKMVGPIIYTFGNEEQKARCLPDILSSDSWWCQGYSEPGSGSDLASLKTKADRAGDHYIVNGTKTWTTLAQYADWIFCLVRTSSDVARRQEGISFLLIDMKSAGVSVKPIPTIDGGREINEVHFDNVEVPVTNLIGEEGKGWTYGKVLLQHERTNMATVPQSRYRLRKLKSQAAGAVDSGTPLMDDPRFARKVAAAEIELKALEYTELRTLAAIAVGKSPGPESSILKVKGTVVQQMLDELFLEAAGYYALPFLSDRNGLDFADIEETADFSNAQASLTYFNNRKATIYGGSNEIQKNIIAKHVLGL
jgi:alkylation response protein AidB-like acyl-CoA dehydrogenase